MQARNYHIRQLQDMVEQSALRAALERFIQGAPPLANRTRRGKGGYKTLADGSVRHQDEIEFYVLPAGSAPTRKTRNRFINATAAECRRSGFTRREARDMALAADADRYGE